MTLPHLVHDLAGRPGAGHWPPITAAEVVPVLARFGRRGGQVLWRSPRPLSAAALVQSDAGTVFVKRHHPAVRTVDGLAEEHAFAGHLRARGVNVPPVLALPDGTSAVALAGVSWEVHECGSGHDLYRDTPSWQPFVSVGHAHAAGAALARLQLAATDFDAPARAPQPLVTSWQAISAPDLHAGLASYLRDRPAVAAALVGRPWRRDVEQVLRPLHDRLAPHLPALRSGWTHGDGHASNLLWSAQGAVTTVLDLGLADRTTPLVDLATAIERNAVGWLSPAPTARLDLVEGLLDGWSSVRPLSRAEAGALPELLPLVHLEFALSELGYFAAVTRSRADADLAYDYAVGHGRWFGRPAGSALLRYLRHLSN